MTPRLARVAWPAALVTGSKLCRKHLNEILKACHSWPEAAEKVDRKKNTRLAAALRAAQNACVPQNYVERVVELAAVVIGLR